MFDLEWYQSLGKPALTPPPEAFQTVWPVLYILMAVSFYFYLKQTPKIQRPLGIIFFCLQLFLNFLWSPVFFGMQRIGSALLVLSLLIVTVACTVWIFNKTSRLAAGLLLPYFVWILFAWYLNFEIWRLN
ncbi:MAG: tryptophan-rich sensory protein [Proteobacteria bacterium]|nr:tryptophan-rich sensory protein [Pseudomonadota bacterium]